MKIYTKTGDDGTTGLYNGKRLSKADLRIETYGTVDELNSVIGLITTYKLNEDMSGTMMKINNILFILGSDLAAPLDSPVKADFRRIDEKHIEWLESKIDEYSNKLPDIKNFILPGGTRIAAHLHHARTVCRRAERLAVALSFEDNIGDFIIKFLNRLSDFLFTAARMANHIEGIEDVLRDKNIE